MRSGAAKSNGRNRDSGSPRPEATHLVLAEDVVAGKQLIGSFAREHDLEARIAHGLSRVARSGVSAVRSVGFSVSSIDARKQLRDVGAADTDIA